MSTAETETRFSGFHGNCFRCGGYGHYADDSTCPWLRKAATPKEHQARINSLTMRFLESEMTPRQRNQKSEYIRQENEMWKAA